MILTERMNRTNTDSMYNGQNDKTGKATVSGVSHYHSYYKPISHSHNMSHYHILSGTTHSHDFSVPSHTHSVSVPSHSHSFTVPAHSHSFTVQSHTHTVTIPNHTHQTTIPGHSHSIQAGIYRSGNPQTMTFKVNGAEKGTYAGRSTEIDITDWLLNKDGNINRGSWQTFSVIPDDLAHISVVITILGFIQSMEGGTY